MSEGDGLDDMREQLRTMIETIGPDALGMDGFEDRALSSRACWARSSVPSTP